MRKGLFVLCLASLASLCSCAAHYGAKTRLHEVRRDVLVQEARVRTIEATTPLSEVIMADGTTFRTYRQASGHIGTVKEASSMASGIAAVANSTAVKIFSGGIAASMLLKQAHGDIDTGGGAYTSNSGNTNSVDTVDVTGEDGTTLDQSVTNTTNTDSHDATSTPIIVEPNVVRPEIVNPEIIYTPATAGE